MSDRQLIGLGGPWGIHGDKLDKAESFNKYWISIQKVLNV